MFKCLKCGKEIAGRETFCTGCGTRLYLCEKCGAPYTPGDVFCESCGNRLPQAQSASFTSGDKPVASNQTAQQEINKNSTLNKVIAGLLVLCALGSGYYLYKQNVVVPREKAIAAEKAEAERQALEAARKASNKADLQKDLDMLAEKTKLKNEFDDRLASAANAINANHAYTVSRSLQELRDEIDKEYKAVDKLNVTDASKNAKSLLKDLFYYERLRAIGMIRGVRGDTSGYTDGGNAYDKYQDSNAKYEQEIAKLKNS